MNKEEKKKQEASFWLSLLDKINIFTKMQKEMAKEQQYKKILDDLAKKRKEDENINKKKQRIATLASFTQDSFFIAQNKIMEEADNALKQNIISDDFYNKIQNSISIDENSYKSELVEDVKEEINKTIDSFPENIIDSTKKELFKKREIIEEDLPFFDILQAIKTAISEIQKIIYDLKDYLWEIDAITDSELEEINEKINNIDGTQNKKTTDDKEDTKSIVENNNSNIQVEEKKDITTEVVKKDIFEKIVQAAENHTSTEDKNIEENKSQNKEKEKEEESIAKEETKKENEEKENNIKDEEYKFEKILSGSDIDDFSDIIPPLELENFDMMMENPEMYIPSADTDIDQEIISKKDMSR